jgi:CubicO group peptidase (beta-lactamase class C family)
MNKTRILFFVIPFLLLIQTLLTNAQTPLKRHIQPSYWPTNGWKTSTPEKQGISSKKLLEMLEFANSKKFKQNAGSPNIGIDSILVIRNGYIVMDTYFYPYSPKYKHQIFSCSKSITSILVGIAIDKGFIKDVSQTVISFFPDKKFKNMSKNKQKITIKNLLTMKTGLATHDSVMYNWEGLLNEKMKKSQDWVQYILDLPATSTPGTLFDYSNFSTFLLSAIIQKTSRMPTQDFAEKYLFKPLEIQDFKCDLNPQGNFLGFMGFNLKPHDLAKIGFLCLNQGKWNNKQIVSSKWIAEATRDYAAGYPSSGYGYQWWLDNNNPGLFIAWGNKGQMLIIDPINNLIAVFFSNISKPRMLLPLYHSYILQAIISERPLPPATETENILKNLENKIQLPPPEKPVPPMPVTAKEISDKYYKMQNEVTSDTMYWIFDFTKDTASLKEISFGKILNFNIGLNSRYKFTKNDCNGSAAEEMKDSVDKTILNSTNTKYFAINKIFNPFLAAFKSQVQLFNKI